VGNNNNKEMKRGADGSIIAAPIWNQYMAKAHEGLAVENFAGYTPVVTDKPILNGLFAVETKVNVDKFSGKLATEYTPPAAIEERTFKQIHDTLYYIEKDNPQGPGPTNPTADPQYPSWEAGVQDWVTRQKANPDPAIAAQFDFINEAPPTEFDDLHQPGQQPTIFLNYPRNNDTITTPIMNSSVTVSAPRGISRVEYYIDDVLVQRATSAPYSMNYTISSMFVNGYHKLKAVAFDDIDNQNEVQIDINILTEKIAVSLSWESPNEGQYISKSQLPYNTTIRLADILATKKVDFYYRKTADSDYTLYSSSVAPDTENLSAALPAMDYSGGLDLKVFSTLKNGSTIQSPVLTVTIGP
jgi:hypothetical protein